MKSEDAEEYTQALGQVVAGGWRQIALGQRLGVPKALGLSTQEWVKQRLGGYVRQSIPDRRATTAEMRAEGYSPGEISAVLGVSEMTVSRDSHVTNVTETKQSSRKNGDGSQEDVTNVNDAPLELLASLSATNAIRQEAETTAARAEREAAREQERQANAAKVATVTDPRELLKVGRFATIVIDPPWDFKDEGDVNHFGRGKQDYAPIPIEQLLTLPVDELADKDCHLYLWITNRSLPKGFRLLTAWGFRYVTCLTWCKPSIGIGKYFRGSTEQILFAVKGSQPLKRKDVGTAFHAPRGGKRHSQKPDVFFKLVESCSPSPYLELFQRKTRSGWTGWGEDAQQRK